MHTSPLRVGINARYLKAPMSGIERYLNELMGHAEPAKCAFLPRSIEATSAPSRFFRRLEPVRHALWDRYLNLLDRTGEEMDVFHAPSFIAPRMRSKTPTVVTVHDLAFLVHPEFFDRRTKAYFAAFFKPSLREARRIICVSHTTANHLVRFYPFVQDRVRVIYNGFTDFSTIRQDEHVIERLGLAVERYILCVGALNARKNIRAIIDLAPKLRAEFPGYKIVVVGRLPVSHVQSVDDSVIFTGHITDAELAALYRNASVFTYPSLFEGFGFPVLEAMSVGTPVVCSKSSCLPEISGLDEEHLFDPLNPDDIYDKIAGSLSGGRAAFDCDRANATLEQFSWAKMYAKTYNVYRECAQ